MSGRSPVAGQAAYEAIVRACGGTPKKRTTQVRCPAHDDTNPSMSVTIGDDDVVLWHCHASCDQREVTDALRRSLPDLFDRSAPRNSGRVARDAALRASPEATARAQSDRPHYQHVCFYDYTDESGNPVHRVERKEAFDSDGMRVGKEFPQSHWDGTGWSPGVKGISLRLYHLADIIGSADSADTVWYCEGEKDADRLRRLGLIATTNAKETATLDRLDVTPLAGRLVIILVDNDDAGRKTAGHVARKIAPVASSVRLLELPGLPEKGDVSDWLDAGGKPGHLWDLAAAAPEYRAPVPDAPDARAIDHQPLTDQGNAERLIARHGENLRYVHAWQTWLIWDGMRWQPDQTGGAMRLAVETIREPTNVASAERSPDMPSARRTALVKHAERSENRQRLQAMLMLAQDLPGVGIVPDQLDRGEWLLNVATGTVDLRTRTLAPHRREDYITRIAEYKGRPLRWVPDLDPDMPLFWAFLNRVQPDPAVRHFLRRALGYSITGSTRERRLFVCHGVGRNGKTTLLELVRDVIGAGYSQVLPSDILMARKVQPNAGSASPDLASLHGARFVLCAETDHGGRLNEGRVKWLTGDDTIQARRLFEAPFTFTPSHTVWLTTNHRPQVRDGGEALWDRLILIPFDVRITDEEQDKSLPQRMRDEEAEGVLDWLIEGAHHWYRDGLRPPKNVLAATESYREESDWFGEFLDHACEVGDGLQVLSAALHKAYTQWAQDSSERLLNPSALGTVLRERGFVADRAAKGRRIWTGLKLLTQTGTSPEPEDYPER